MYSNQSKQRSTTKHKVESLPTCPWRGSLSTSPKSRPARRGMRAPRSHARNHTLPLLLIAGRAVLWGRVGGGEIDVSTARTERNSGTEKCSVKVKGAK